MCMIYIYVFQILKEAKKKKIIIFTVMRVAFSKMSNQSIKSVLHFESQKREFFFLNFRSKYTKKQQ